MRFRFDCWGSSGGAGGNLGGRGDVRRGMTEGLPRPPGAGRVPWRSGAYSSSPQNGPRCRACGSGAVGEGGVRGSRSRPTASRGTPRSSRRRSCRRGRPTSAARRRRRWRACTCCATRHTPQARPSGSSSTSRCTCCPRRKHRSESRLGKTGVNVCLDMLAALTDQCNSRLHHLACGKGASEPGLRAMG